MQDTWGPSEAVLQRQASPSLLRKFAEVGFICAEVRPLGSLAGVPRSVGPRV